MSFLYHSLLYSKVHYSSEFIKAIKTLIYCYSFQQVSIWGKQAQLFILMSKASKRIGINLWVWIHYLIIFGNSSIKNFLKRNHVFYECLVLMFSSTSTLSNTIKFSTNISTVKWTSTTIQGTNDDIVRRRRPQIWWRQQKRCSSNSITAQNIAR